MLERKKNQCQPETRPEVMSHYKAECKHSAPLCTSKRATSSMDRFPGTPVCRLDKTASMTELSNSPFRITTSSMRSADCLSAGISRVKSSQLFPMPREPSSEGASESTLEGARLQLICCSFKAYLREYGLGFFQRPSRQWLATRSGWSRRSVQARSLPS